MTTPVRELDLLLKHMQPVRQPGSFVLCMVPHGSDISALPVHAMLREAEGITLVLAAQDAARHGLAPLFRCAWITLQVHSDLQAVGLTAAFSGALAQAGISCNVLAGACHDHILVPEEDAARAMEVLQALQTRA